MALAVHLPLAGRHAVEQAFASERPVEVEQAAEPPLAGAAAACQGERQAEGRQEYQERPVFREQARRWEGGSAAAPCLGAYPEEADEQNSGLLQEEERGPGDEVAAHQADRELGGGPVQAAAEAAGPWQPQALELQGAAVVALVGQAVAARQQLLQG